MGFLRHGILLVALFAACSSESPTLVVVEEHHHAWPAWERARASGVIEAGALLVHFDAHEDMGEPSVPEAIRADPVLAETLVESELTVEDVVVPALFTGTVSEFIWVTPPWLEEPGREMVRQIGSVNSEGRILRLDEDIDRCPDNRQFRERVLPLTDLRLIEGPVILDIDLDFFACENPHTGHVDYGITREEYDRFYAEGVIAFEGGIRQKNGWTESAIFRRPPGAFTWPVRLDRIVAFGGEASYVRGFMCMGEYTDSFPVHRPSDEEIRVLVGEFKDRLAAAKLTPALITISRSAQSGFVPADRVDFIEKLVVECLEGIYGVQR